MITTKKGKKNSFNVSINSGLTFGSIDKSTFAKYQKEYGAGYGKASPPNASPDGGFLYYDIQGNGEKQLVTQFSEDASYGPKFDPTLMVYQWDAFDPFSPGYHQATPWVAAKNDPSTFYQNSTSSNQNLTMTGGAEHSTYKFAYTRSDEKGILPNSKLTKDMFNINFTQDLTKKLTLSTSANYTRIKGLGRYGTGYNGNNPTQQFRQWWQVNVDLEEMKEAYFRNHQNITWNWKSPNNLVPIYSDNPYWTRYQNFSDDSRNRYFGYASLNYKVTDWFDVVGRIALDGSDEIQEERVAVGSADPGSYSRFNRTYQEVNYDLLLNFHKSLNEAFTFKGLLGSNMRRSRTGTILARTNGGLVVPGLYSLSNSLSPITSPTETSINIGVDGLFASATLGYKDYLFLEVVGRRDKSTTLPEDDNA
jgi:hypothetical protein